MKVYVGILLILFSLFSYAGPLPPDNLSGQTLRVWLKENWHEGKHNDLGYDEARRAMYSFIDKGEDGMVTGVYSGFKQKAENTTFLNPINAEHTIPQSWFNEKSPMKSDIHHLFPTHKNVNSTRGSSPFVEIDDNLTEKWITAGNPGLKIIKNNIPTDKIDSFSEVIGNKAFEPREDHKGNLARAVYYFYTMYPDTVGGGISRIAKKEILFQWHQNDPVDADEKERNDRIEERQGNRNPYIDHPELVAIAWGHDDDGDIDPNIVNNIEALKTEISKLETTLENLKVELARLENSLND